MKLRHWYFPPDQNLSAQPNKTKQKKRKKKRRRPLQVTRNPLLGRKNTTYLQSLSAWQDSRWLHLLWSLACQSTVSQQAVWNCLWGKLCTKDCFAANMLCSQQLGAAVAVQRSPPRRREEHLTEQLPISTEDLALAQSAYDGWSQKYHGPPYGFSQKKNQNRET